jgi:signal peptidase
LNISDKGFSVYMSELMPLISDSLQSGQTVRIKVRGNSMYPFLLDTRDSVTFAPLIGRPVRRGDIILFRRTNGSYIMHRVYSVDKNGVMQFIGDAQYTLEHNIKREQAVAFVPSVVRNGREISCDKGAWRRAMTLFMLMRIKCPGLARLIYNICCYGNRFLKELGSALRFIKRKLNKEKKS